MAVKRKFECHITIPREFGPIVRTYWDGVQGWGYSQIDGDPILGKQVYCYLTRYDSDAVTLLSKMKETVGALRTNHIPVLREKIEEIIYDTKTGHDVIEVGR